MNVLLRIYDVVSLSLMVVAIWMVYGAGGGLMEKKWEKMKWMMDKHHHDHGKSIGISVKPIAIPIPLPLPVPMVQKYVAKGPPPEKPWKAESKDMLWKMMMMKMMTKGDKGCCPKKVMMPVMMKADKGKGKGGCPMMSGWPMMKAMMKAAPMMCTPMMSSGCDMAMDKGWPAPMMSGWPAPMMTGWPAPMMTGWPAPMMKGGNMMCCPSMMGGWPDEEEEGDEEEEEYPDYEEEQMSGWDTYDDPTYSSPRRNSAGRLRAAGLRNSKKGDASDVFNRKSKGMRTGTLFRKGM